MNNKRRHCEFKNGKETLRGVFIQYIGLESPCPKAILEMDDGTVMTPPVYRIRFIDPPGAHKQHHRNPEKFLQRETQRVKL